MHQRTGDRQLVPVWGGGDDRHRGLANRHHAMPVRYRNGCAPSLRGGARDLRQDRPGHLRVDLVLEFRNRTAAVGMVPCATDERHHRAAGAGLHRGLQLSHVDRSVGQR